MQSVVSKSILASIVTVAVAVGVASAKAGRSSGKTGTIEISQNAQVPNGPTLKPRTY